MRSPGPYICTEQSHVREHQLRGHWQRLWKASTSWAIVLSNPATNRKGTPKKPST